jgi:hypothetical protein
MLTDAKRLSILLFPLALSCSSAHNAKDVRTVMDHYDQLILKLDGDGIANTIYLKEWKLPLLTKCISCSSR